MAYNRLNKLYTYKKVIDIVNEHYEDGVTTYKGVWRAYVNPVYPMSYQTFINIINMPNIERQIQAECDKLGRENNRKKLIDKNQLKLFQNENDNVQF